MSKHITPDMIIVGGGVGRTTYSEYIFEKLFDQTMDSVELGSDGLYVVPTRNIAEELISHTVKEAKQLSEILELDSGITIAASHPFFLNKKERPKKSFWKNGKLRYK